MRKFIYLVFFISFTLFAQSKSLTGLYASAMTNDGNKIYLFGGLADQPYGTMLKSQLSSLVNNLLKYIPGENIWEEDVPSDNTKPEGRYNHSMGSNSNSVYIFGGYNDKDLLSDIHIFNLSTKKWNKVNQPSTLSGRMKYGFVQTDNGFYVIGGATPSDQPIKENWHYNINTNQWTRKNDVPFTDTHINAATKVSSDKIFVFKKQGTDKFYIYNELTDTWREQTTTGEIPKERYNGICVTSGKKVYVGGGYVSSDGRSKDFYELDTDSWVWKKLMDIPKELYGPASTAMNDRIYVYGGIDNEAKKSNKFYEYNIGTNTWVEKGTIVGVEEEMEIPTEIKLYQNYPNPFNPTTTIIYTIANVGSRHASTVHVMLKIYDILGKEVKTLVNENKEPGRYVETFHGTSLPSGIYFYRLTVSNPSSGSGEIFSQTKKLMLLK